MFKAQTITSKQKKHTLSVKKKPTNSYKNILINPTPKYWPEISIETANNLKQLLVQIFDTDYSPVQNICLNGVSTNVIYYNSSDVVKIDKKFLIFGLQKVLRLLKLGKLTSVLVSTNLKPHFIVQQLILLGFTQNRNIKVICVPDLENIFTRIISFSCKVIGVVDDTKGPYRRINDWVKEKAQIFPIPQHLLDLYKHNEKPKEIVEKKTKIPTKDTEKIENYHLNRDVNNQRRAFIPLNAKKTKKIITNDILSIDCGNEMEIDEQNSDDEKLNHEKRKELLRETLQNLVIPKTEKKTPTQQQFISLKVKKIQGNVNKVKKKGKK